ncbi:MAG: peptide chain release factor N(5)-glutamine methyltransferase [Candidatus Falkowbacteria bacterium]
MTITQSIKLAVTKLKSSDATNVPHLEAEILLSETLKKPREFILSHGEQKLTKSQVANYKLLIKKRLKGMPVAYITGEKEFYGLKFKVNKNVLIPRPETELMVEETVKLAARNPKPATLIDVGTGSGCIIITLAKILNQKSRISLLRQGFGEQVNYKLWGIDISKKALTVARQNAQMHHVNKKIKFVKGNLLEPLLKNYKLPADWRNNHRPLVILANLPYLAPAQIKNSPTIKYEPKSALDGGQDGLKYYRQLFRQINKLLAASHEPRDIYTLCEIDPEQTAKIKQLIKNKLPEATLQIKKDLSGLNRLAIISIKNL